MSTSSAPPPNQDPRKLFLFMVLSFAMILGTNVLLDKLGFLPEPPKPDQAAEKKAPAEPGKEAIDPAAGAGEAVVAQPDPAQPPPPAVAEIGRERLILGSVVAADGYHLEAELEQRGAGVWKVRSALHDAEFEPKQPKDRPMTLVQGSLKAPLPLSIAFLQEQPEGSPVPIGNLESRPWDVLVGDRLLSDLDTEARREANPVRPVLDAQNKEIGQAISFRTTGGEAGPDAHLQITKTYRLLKGKDAMEVELTFLDTSAAPAADGKPREIAYRLQGPYGMPIEGDWYTYTFRNGYLAKEREGTVAVETHSAQEVAGEVPGTYESTQLPLAFAGVENQYFAVFLKPEGGERLDARTVLTSVGPPPAELKLADLSAEIDSKPIPLAPGAEARQTFTLFAGPKTADALTTYGAEELANYRTIGHVPVIGFIFDLFNAILNPPVTFLSRQVISPLLGFVYRTTRDISGWFGGARGSYGIAIILLTVIVRLGMFPLSRRQALSAKRMQELQPHMVALREKYKDDKEKVAQETFALYRKYGINPLAGCLPVMVQIPIFMALWRTLNVSVALRQAPFLWMDNLAAPDMLFSFGRLFGEGASVPLLGPYFNLLPLAVVALMFVQTKLFAPPATTPEQEMQQKVMKYMMVFMAVMFYRVPSGLAVYFITSSLWSIGERVLLPKLSKNVQLPDPSSLDDDKSKAPGPGRGGWLAKKLQALMEEAEKERTYRKQAGGSGNGASNGSGNGAKPDESSGPRGGPGSPDTGKKKRPRPDRSGPPGKNR